MLSIRKANRPGNHRIWGARPLPSIRQTVMIFQGDVDNQTAENIALPRSLPPSLAPSLPRSLAPSLPYGSPAIFIHDWTCQPACQRGCLLGSSASICQMRAHPKPKQDPKDRLCYRGQFEFEFSGTLLTQVSEKASTLPPLRRKSGGKSKFQSLGGVAQNSVLR